MNESSRRARGMFMAHKHCFSLVEKGFPCFACLDKLLLNSNLPPKKEQLFSSS